MTQKESYIGTAKNDALYYSVYVEIHFGTIMGPNNVSLTYTNLHMAASYKFSCFLRLMFDHEAIRCHDRGQDDKPITNCHKIMSKKYIIWSRISITRVWAKQRLHKIHCNGNRSTDSQENRIQLRFYFTITLAPTRNLQSLRKAYRDK